MTSKMRPFKDTIPLDQARALIEGAIHPIARTERVPSMPHTDASWPGTWSRQPTSQRSRARRWTDTRSVRETRPVHVYASDNAHLP